MFDATGAYVGGYSYTPYGELRSATSNATITANSIRYAGGYWDSSVNLYRFGARYYDPTIGRFTQYDQTGQESNPYSYAGDEPINSNDPSGNYRTIAYSVCYIVCAGAGVTSDRTGRAVTGQISVTGQIGGDVSYTGARGPASNSMGWTTSGTLGPFTATHQSGPGGGFSKGISTGGVGFGLGYSATQFITGPKAG